MPMPARITVLAGGVGAARFLRGLILLADESNPPPRITAIGNTADDLSLFGLRVCPDLDTVMYTLGGGSDETRGWGRSDESFRVLGELRGYDAGPHWFQLGDLDLATHLVRNHLLGGGATLSQVTATLCKRWAVPIRLLPMSDDAVETHVTVRGDGSRAPSAVHFQEWWVRDGADPPACGFTYVGAESARPGPGVIDALAETDLILVAPSNPIVSVGPILAIPGVRAALASSPAPVVGVSPIIGGSPVRGMADRCLTAVGVPVSALGVAGHYGSRHADGILDAWLIDEVDSEDTEHVRALGIRCDAAPTLMADQRRAAQVARRAVELGDSQ